MTKRLTALVMTLVMILSVAGVNTFARYSVEDGSYNYRKTEDVEASIEGDKVVITWPAVDKSGNLINANPLESDSLYGDPKGSWTYPTQGMIIEYPNWKIDGTHTANPTQLNTGECNILYGLTDNVTDYPVVCVSDKTGEKIKDAYIDGTVVANNFATAYKIEYSKDGEKWTLDHMMTTVNHGKKLYRKNDDGTFSQDSKSTFFLEDQYVEALTGNLEENTEYFIRVTATNAAKTTDNFKEFTTKITTPQGAVKYPAFPTVEGGGTYSQGGRGTETQPADVYVVTNLTDSVSDPQPGSLRYGLERRDRSDGNSEYPRIITFAVEGVINIDPAASKSARRFNIGSNTTLLGQTAPGEGITVYGASIKFTGENIISRYIRFRLGEGYDLDAATATGENIVIDHCTFSWGVDESFSAKEIINSSIQYNIIANSMTFPDKTGVNNNDAEINAGESEAKHGMGSIINGSDVTYTHNLWANHGTRNPRFEGGFTYNSVTYGNKLEFSNNVIYNWGHNSGYGGERGSGQTNMIGNYYKPGPNTLEKVNTRIFDIDGSTSKYYFKDNVMTSSAEVTANNRLGYNDVSDSAVLSSPVELVNPYSATSAEEAYNKVLDSVGASYVRDAQDARLIDEVKNGTGGFINDEFEAGGIGTATGYQAEAPKDTDGDGIPDEWEASHGLDPNDKSDATVIVTDETKSYCGYTNVEVYANDILGEWEESTVTLTAPENPVPSINGITSSEDGGIVSNGNSTDVVNYTVFKGFTYSVVKNIAGEYDSYKILLNDKVLAENTDEFTIPSDLEEGMYYLSVLAEGNKGSGISSTVHITVVDSDGKDSNLEGFTSVDIGSVGVDGSDYYNKNTNELVSTGAGHMGILNTSSTQNPDAFHFNYTTVTGDFTFTAKMDNLAKLDYMQQSGLMVRGSLDEKSEFYMPSLTYIKGEDYEGLIDIAGNTTKAKNVRTMYRSTDGGSILYTNNMLGVAAVRVGSEPNYGWAKIERKGQVVALYASLNGTDWYKMDEFTTTLPETVYVGFATDAAQDSMPLVKYNGTVFSNISLETTDVEIGSGDVVVDGKLDINDVNAVFDYVLDPEKSPLTEEQLANARVSGNMNITTRDVAQILQKVLDPDYEFTK
ncbi:MAG: hypothetical protein Q4F63_00815 [Clostridia bacterium]|nr:hypothetical protein [Clostridia bacterium]